MITAEGAMSWVDMWRVNPTAFNGSAQQEALVLGGKSCMWGETVDATNVLPKMWPRASAAAERLWSEWDDATVADVAGATARLRGHRCRLVARGIPAAPMNPAWGSGVGIGVEFRDGSCPIEFDLQYDGP
jgi:hexosaminidase